MQNTVLHLLPDNELVIEDDVVIGPGAMIHGCHIEAGTVVEPAAIICDYSRVRAGSLVQAGHVSATRANFQPNRCSMTSGRGRGDAGRATGAAVMGADPPGARDPAAAVMAAAEPEPEAEKVADATATIGTDRYHVDLRAGRHVLAADEPADHGRADTGPSPFGLLLSGLGACTTITLRVARQDRTVGPGRVDVQLVYTVQDRASRWIDRRITLRGPLGATSGPGWPRSPRRRRSPGRVRAGTEIHTTVDQA